MLIRVPPIFRPRASRKHPRRTTGPTPPPVALTLVAAEYIDVPALIRLTFDRAIDIAALVGGQITVDDGEGVGTLYAAVGTATLVTPEMVEIALSEVAPSSTPGVLLSAGAGNGIVAADDGGQWAGVTNLSLPFP